MTLQLHHTVEEFRAACDRVRASAGRLGLVPTMGALHAGHLSLVDVAKARTNAVALTIFVNPTQFGPNEDFARYPRTLEQDLALCEARGVDHVFAPSVEQMYPPGEKTRVSVAGLTDVLCGPKRPGHFDGVATIVSKLFHVAGPCLAVFGRKDYQQLQVIRRMVTDLLLPIEVVGHATVRESDGLALSSRNAFLSAAERSQALVISRELARAQRAFAQGERRAGELRRPVEAEIQRAGLRVDYVELTTADNLEPLADGADLPARALLAVAAFAGKTRLIDNLVLGEDPAPVPEARA